jgi:hypothetical protein
MFHSDIQQTLARTSPKSFWFDFAFFSACACSAMALAHLAYGPEQTGLTHLGGEYLHISRAMVTGQGYSNPFGKPTGATAWMPPLIPYFMAGCLGALGFAGLLTVFLVVHVASIAYSFALVVSIARQFGLTIVGYVLVILIGNAYSAELFCCTHDSGILLLLTTLTVTSFFTVQESRPSLSSSIRWGGWGGLLALASPALALAWAAMLCCRWIRFYKSLLIAASVSIVVITPWCMRNYLVFGHWIPIKSNAGFDAWQANVDDEDGVIDQSNTDRHPINHQNERGAQHLAQIQALGENAYNQKLGNEFRAWVFAHPDQYFAKIGRRFVSSVILHENMRKGADSFWVYYPRILSIGLFVFTLIVVAMRVRLPSFFNVGLAFMTFYLLPYWFLSYYERYGAPMVTVKALIVLGATIAVRDWYRARLARNNPVQALAIQPLPLEFKNASHKSC